MSLFAAACRGDKSRILLITPNTKLACAELSSLEHNHGALLRRVYQRRVALSFNDPFQLAQALLLLDGICTQLMILPPEADATLRSEFLLASNSDIVLSEEAASSSLTVEVFFPEAATPPQRDVATVWLLPTSGTTGVPKLIPHTIISLTRSVRMDADCNRQTIWGLFYQLHRFAGLQVFFQAVCGGATLAIPPQNAPMAHQIKFFREVGITALSGTPTLWRKLLMADIDGLPLTQLTLGGEIVSQVILDALAQRFATARITHIYASTELGVGFSISDRRAGFPAQWLAEEGSGLKLDGITGELLCRDPATDGPYQPSGDLVEIVGERVYFRGRCNGSINVGGNKVMPEEVEQVLLDFPGVMLAAVSGMKSSFAGQLVRADLVVDRGQVADIGIFRQELQRHCRERLAAFKIPALINLVENLEISAAGKVIRGGNQS